MSALAFARCVGESRHAPVVLVTAPVEHDLLDTGLLGPLGQQLADLGRRLPLGQTLEGRLVGTGRRQRVTAGVVDDLGVDALVGACDAQARPLGSTLTCVACARSAAAFAARCSGASTTASTPSSGYRKSNPSVMSCHVGGNSTSAKSARPAAIALRGMTVQ